LGVNETSTIITTKRESDFINNGENPPALVVLHGADLGTSFHLNKEIITIGRSNKNDLTLRDDNISRKHAEVLTQNNEVWLRDLDSTNGIFVNSKRISEQQLHDGDIIMISNILLKFVSSTSIENQFFLSMFEMATKDSLTKTNNKHHLLNRLEKEFKRAVRHNRALCLMLYDIDHFKNINDTYGHLAGDIILAESSEIISARLRSDDTFGRFGGDEFAVICPETSLSQAECLAERIRTIIEKEKFDIEVTKVNITISIGVAELTPDIKTVEQLFTNADKALYVAKEQGRNRIYDSSKLEINI